MRTISCGSFHNAAISRDGDLFTWGSNGSGCLGRTIDEKYSSFTAHPGICSCFGTIVNRIGRGLPSSVACGKDFTVVATYPYDGPREDLAKKLMEEKKHLDEVTKQKAASRQEQLNMDSQKRKDKEKRMDEIRYLTTKRLCVLDPKCPGMIILSSLVIRQQKWQNKVSLNVFGYLSAT